MKIIERLLAIMLFLVLVGFAIVNTSSVELQFIGTDLRWKQPLVVFLLLFFAAGIACGLLAVIPTWFRQKREIARLKKSNRKMEAAAQAAQSAQTAQAALSGQSAVKTLPADALSASRPPIPL